MDGLDDVANTARLEIALSETHGQEAYGAFQWTDAHSPMSYFGQPEPQGRNYVADITDSYFHQITAVDSVSQLACPATLTTRPGFLSSFGLYRLLVGISTFRNNAAFYSRFTLLVDGLLLLLTCKLDEPQSRRRVCQRRCDIRKYSNAWKRWTATVPRHRMQL